MRIRRPVLTALAAALITASSAQVATAHEGPPPRFKACGAPFTYSDDHLGEKVTLTLAFPVSYVGQRADVVMLKLSNLSPFHFAGGYVEGMAGASPHSYNLAPVWTPVLPSSHWFSTPVLTHHGGVLSVSATIRPIPGRQTVLGGRFWVPSLVVGCKVTI